MTPFTMYLIDSEVYKRMYAQARNGDRDSYRIVAILQQTQKRINHGTDMECLVCARVPDRRRHEQICYAVGLPKVTSNETPAMCAVLCQECIQKTETWDEMCNTVMDSLSSKFNNLNIPYLDNRITGPGGHA